tara:strand:- start:8388 stop:8723 length:336 start_codon:yes stop_codon:yes gene_type:complete
MANTYIWKINECNRILSNGMIKTIHYAVNATDENKTDTVGMYGSVGLEPADEKDMIPYEDVTEAQCISWTQTAIGGTEKIAELYASLDSELVLKKTPINGSGLPWSTPELN